MPFLLPALVAVVCDICVIYISSFTPHHDPTTANSGSSTGSNDDEDHWIYYTIDIYCGSIAALLRLLIVCIPLLYHSYTGTAIRYTIWYRTIYIGMTTLIVFHIISFLIIQPKSIESIIIISAPTSSTAIMDAQYEYRRLWLLLLFSSVSLFVHHILLRHVRSTAPTPPMMLQMLQHRSSSSRIHHSSLKNSSNRYNFFQCGNYIQNTVQPTMYFAVRTAAAAAAAAAAVSTTTRTETTQQSSARGARTTTSSPTKAENPSIHSSDDTLQPLHVNNRSNGHNYDLEAERYGNEGMEQEPALINAMNEFLMQMQAQIQRTKQDWSSRLEDFGHRIQQQQHSSSTTGTGTDKAASTATASTSSLSPFRVLLQLFAYEDVLDNHKLDAVFDMDDGTALTFYVPQLLSFLLHGALYTSPALEDWILNKCRTNIYFAHQCYWYLRAWCLEVPAESRPITPSISRRNSATSLCNGNLTNGVIGTILSQQQSQSNSSIDGLPFLDEPAVPEKKQLSKNGSARNLCLPDHDSASSKNNNNNSSARSRSSSASVPPPPASATVENDKFLIPEERAMIEQFMMRVKECGQIPAYTLEFGTKTTKAPSTTNGFVDTVAINSNTSTDLMNYEALDSPDQSTSKLTYRGGMNTGSVISNHNKIDCSDNNIASSIHTVMKSLADSGKIPMDPDTGNPSKAHYDALLLRQKSHLSYGFRTIQFADDGTNTNDNDTAQIIPSTIAPRQSETEQFDKTTQFLDALIFLAENLHYVPRENRRDTLQQQLRSLECELLPCNSIYLPIGNRNQYHRVWRIAADESIAISTKERVPCIIALEVIDFSLSMKNTSHASCNEFNNDTNIRSTNGALPENGINSNGVSHLTTSPPTFVNQNYQNDVDSLTEWRYGYRNPLRYVPFLDKVTTSVKVPFAKMKTQVRHHFNHLRDRGVAEEMQALSSADALVGIHNQARNSYGPIEVTIIEDRSSIGSSQSNAIDNETDINLSSVENGTTGISNGNSLLALSRVNSSASLVSLGQWSSPSALQRTVSNPEKNYQQHDMNEIRLRLDSTLQNRSRRNSPLLYGSDQEDETSDRSVNATSGLPPSGRRSLGKEIVNKDQTVSTRPPPVVFRESWVAKQERVRQKSALGDHHGWKLLAILIKGNDDLRQEQLAAQLIKRMATILASERVNVWLCPYEIIATTNRGGVIEAIPDTISIDSLKKNDPNYTTLNDFFLSHYGDDTDELAGAKANFVESLAAYSMVCFILQLKDRHNGNILLDKWGHIIHIDFGFFFLSSPGKNAGFESAPFKLTREFVELLEGPNSHHFRTFRELCFKTFIALRRRCMEIILLVEMLKNGNEDLKCFRGRPDDAIQQLRDRFRLDLNDRACKEYVNCLIDDSIENWRTDWYDRYQRYFVGVL